MEWEPIETAPREEFKDLILFNGGNVCAGHYWEGYFVDSMGDYIEPQPTHWMPLPKPPAD